MSARSKVKFRFRLYVADNTQNSEMARANLAALCANYLHDSYEIEIIDVLKDPERALSDGILMTPQLIKLWPAPEMRIVGTLSQTQVVLRVLGLEGVAA